MGAFMAIVDKNTQITGELTQDEITPVEEFAGPQTHTQVYLPPQQKRHNRRSIIGIILTALVLFTILITPPGAFEQSVVSAKQRDPYIVPHVGPFIQQPLSSAQIDALTHLINHMAYTQLPLLYVSHMTLDEELGQFIIAAYYDPPYSSHLQYIPPHH